MRQLLQIIPYLGRHRVRLAVALGGTALFTVLSVLPPLIIRYLIDDVIQPGRWELLYITVAALVAVPVVAAALRFTNARLLVQTSHRFIAEMRLSLYERVMGMSARYFGGTSSGTIAGRVMDDVNMLQRLLTANTIQIFVDVAVFLFAISITFSISPVLALILLGVLFLYVFVYRYFSKRIKAATEAYRAEYDRITGRLQEMLTGMRQVRIFNREEWETEQFLDRMESGLDKALASSMSSTGMNIACNGMTGLGAVAIMFVGALMVLRGEITAGDLIAVNSFAWMAIGPAMNLTGVAGELQETVVSVGRIFELLTKEPEISPNTDAPRMKRGGGGVRFDDVWFSYSSETPLYRGLSFDIAAGTSVALVGPTGCGKTTLTSLLMRYWDVQKGRILIDDTDVASVNLKSLRDLFGVVLQSPVLFDGTLAENIAYGWPDAPREKIEEAVRTAELQSMVQRLPSGLDTVIGTNGVKLSVGEKQRVSIARAIVKDPVLLVMDEATSSLDSESEELIQRALRNVLRGRTSFIIAHRLTTITSADLIMVIDNGAIVDRGTHQELMSRESGLYKNLYNELAGFSRGI